MKIFIAGLGLMGSAYGKKLQGAGHTIYGWDENPDHLEKAHTFLNGQGLIELKNAHVCIIALPPQAIEGFIQTYQDELKTCELITDISSVKGPITKAAEMILGPDNAYISHHPMTGFKTSGPEDASRVVFEQKPVIIIEKTFNPSAHTHLLTILKDLTLRNPVTLSADEHDKWVALTSHLPHILSATLLHHKDASTATRYAGNAWLSMTQYGQMNPTLWPDIFMLNQRSITQEIDGFIDRLQAFKALLNDSEKLNGWLNHPHSIERMT